MFIPKGATFVWAPTLIRRNTVIWTFLWIRMLKHAFELLFNGLCTLWIFFYFLFFFIFIEKVREKYSKQIIVQCKINVQGRNFPWKNNCKVLNKDLIEGKLTKKKKICTCMIIQYPGSGRSSPLKSQSFLPNLQAFPFFSAKMFRFVTLQG